MTESNEPIDRPTDDVVVPIKRCAADYREAYSWQRWHTASWPVLLLAALAIAFLMFSNYDRARAVTFIVADLLGLVGIYYISLFVVASRMQKAHLLNGETTYTFTSDGFDYRSDQSTSSTTWTAVSKAVETRRSYLLIYANSCFLIIPKACVPASKMQHFRSLLQTSLADRIILRSTPMNIRAVDAL